MLMRRCILSAFIFCVISTEQAAHGQPWPRVDLWFEGQDMTPSASVIGYGLGKTLVLECDISHGLMCAWLVTMKIDSEVDLHAWSQDLVTAGSNEVLTEAIFADGGEFEFPFPGLVNDLPYLLRNWGAFSFDPVPLGQYDLLQFILHGAYEPGFLGIVDIYSPIGVMSWEGVQTFDLYVGPNPPVKIRSDETLPAIRIHVVPEPTAGALFCAGGLVCLLARRHVRRRTK